MGKSGSRKKKGGSKPASAAVNSTPTLNAGVDLDSSIFLKRAHELKEEGNKRFQKKDFVGALDKYESALRLTPQTHPDRAVFHSNRAACLMQMNPIDYDTVISECTMALQIQPQFVRALLRRARAYEAIRKYELAMQDVQVLLASEPNHQDALDISQRLRTAVGPRQEAQQDLQSRPSPAALGASAVGAPIAGLGPCLPARPVQKKGSASIAGATVLLNSKLEKNHSVLPAENSPIEPKFQFPKVVLKPSSGPSKAPNSIQDQPMDASFSSWLSHTPSQHQEPKVQLRPLKLVYDHDIRLAMMPVNCRFKVLREIVSKRFPSSKFVLIKYKDADGDLVTVTCTSELRLAELCADDSLVPKNPEVDKTASIGMLRLHVVEVSPEQEPPLLEEEDEKPVETEESKGIDSGHVLPLGESVADPIDSENDKIEKEVQKEKPEASEDPECKEVEMDDWLFEFAQLFRSHVGIDPDGHIDMHELGMDLCSEALEETVTSEEAQNLFNKAASKFQEVAALAFFNWGNVYMCAARKRIPLDESSGKDIMAEKLQTAYEWVKEKYTLAREKYEEALLIKPDFYEGLLALGQQQFEMAKLHWSFALAKKIDLSSWDFTETLELFDSAEEKMNVATEMWGKMEERRENELKDPTASKLEELLKRRKKHVGCAESEMQGMVGGQLEASGNEAAEQAALMKSQIHLFWGNMLFERSQIECKIGTGDWKKNFDAAVERFQLAGASEADISAVLKNHCSNENTVEGADKKSLNINGEKEDIIKEVVQA